jgi:hypothetical protein
MDVPQVIALGSRKYNKGKCCVGYISSGRGERNYVLETECEFHSWMNEW